MPLKINSDGSLPMMIGADGRPYLDPEIEAKFVAAGAGATGPAGPQGPAGPKGDKGDTGSAGAAGTPGTAGTAGAQGPQGIQGPTGQTGQTGQTGSQGIQGVKGDTGSQGIQGIQGPQGNPGVTPVPVYASLANGATAMALGTNDAVKVTPTGNATYTTTVPVAGKHVHVIILTSGVSSFTITFGTGFKPTATLATGTTTARVFVVGFVSDGTNLYETSRTAAMVA